MARLTSRLHYGLYLLLILYVCTFVVIPALREETFGYRDEPGVGLRVRDFGAIMVVARALWSGEPTTAAGRRPGYDLDSLLAINSKWIGRPIDRGMPFPYSPTMLYLLGPLCPLPLAWAFVAWSVLSLAAIGWLVSRPDCPRVLGPLLFLTPMALASFTLGQSAILATAALVYLGRASLQKPTRGVHLGLMVVVLWALTARPQLALTAGVALLAVRQWQPVALAVLLTLLTTALITPLLGPRWVADYLTLLSHFMKVTAPAAYSEALVVTHMNNLRALLTLEGGVRDDWSSKATTAVWLLSLVVVLLGAWLRRVPAAVVWGTCVLVQLLLCPHVNSYELVLLYAVLVFFLHAAALPAAFRVTAPWFIALLLCLRPIGGPFGERPSFLFFGLLTVAGVFVWLCGAALWRRGATPDLKPRRGGS